MSESICEFMEIGAPLDRRRIAVRSAAGAAPGLIWLGGYKSDMKGTKAAALSQWAAAHGRACVRFDYSGHGESDGAFADGTIGRWLEESAAVFARFCRGPQIVVGSSMGGWIALLLARALRQHAANERTANGAAEGTDAPTIAGLVLVAPAVDFTEVLIWERLPEKIRRELEETGVWKRPSEYANEHYLVTMGLIEEGRRHLLLGDMIETGAPVRILQGVQDPDVPWNHAVELVSRLAQDDVVLTLVKDGDHRLSRPEDIERLTNTIAELANEIQPPSPAA